MGFIYNNIGVFTTCFAVGVSVQHYRNRRICPKPHPCIIVFFSLQCLVLLQHLADWLVLMLGGGVMHWLQSLPSAFIELNFLVTTIK